MKVETITSNEQHVRLEIFEGRLPIDEAGAELLRIERAQHESTRRKLLEAQDQIAQLKASEEIVSLWSGVSFCSTT